LAAVGFQTIVLAALNLWLIVFGLRAFSSYESAPGGAGSRWTSGLTFAAIVAIVAVVGSLLLSMRSKRRRVGDGQPGVDARIDPKDASFEYTAWRFHSCRGQLYGALIQSIVLFLLGVSLFFFGIRTLGGVGGQVDMHGMRGMMSVAIWVAVVLVVWFLQGNLRHMYNLRREIGRLRSAINPIVGLRFK
jgi:hypothetical protein